MTKYLQRPFGFWSCVFVCVIRHAPAGMHKSEWIRLDYFRSQRWMHKLINSDSRVELGGGSVIYVSEQKEGIQKE